MSDHRSGLHLLGSALLLVTVGFVGSQDTGAAGVSLVESTISLMPVTESDTASRGKSGAGKESELEQPYVGQLILTASDLQPGDMNETELPCRKGGLAAGNSTPHLEALCDVPGGLDSLKVAYKPRYLGKAEKEHRWSVTASVQGMYPASSLNRYATVVVDGAQYWLTMQYKTPAAVASTLTVAQPPKRWVVARNGDRISLQVHSKGAPVSRLTIANSSLQAADTNERLNVDAFRVCSNSHKCSGDVLLPGDKTTTVYLQANADEMPFGRYSGALTFAADGNALSKPVELLVFSSGTGIRWIGLLLIALGVTLGLIVTVVAPHSAQRLETLRPAVGLRTSSDAWLIRLGESEAATSEDFPQSRRSLLDISATLTDAVLMGIGYVPGRFPLSLKLTTKFIQTYDAYLKDRNDALHVAAAIVASGFEPIADRWPDYTSNPQHTEFVKNALKALDELSRSESRTTVRDSIATILTRLDSDTTGAGTRGRAGIGARRIQTTIESLTAEIRTLNAGVWLIWVLITIAGGWAALIVTNSGFGTLRDLFTCFGWGLGLQVVGPQLQQLTPAKISKQIRVDLPQ